MKVSLRVFTGMRPVCASDLLKPGEATSAINTLLTGGDLAPYYNPLQITALTSASPVLSIYRYGQSSTSETQYWFQSTNDCNFVKGPVDQDTEEKTYFTGHLSYPAKTKNTVATTSSPYPTTSYPMGLQKPASAPSAAVSGTATDPTSAAETVVYVCTLVSAWGEEGPPSDASAAVSWRAGQTVTVTLPTSGTASYPGNSNKAQTYSTKNLYRAATGSSGTATYLLVASGIALATTSYADTTTTANLGGALLTKGWVEPPDDMKGLTQMANGVLAGFSGSTVCFCEPFVPYAWPVKYQQSVDAPVVAMAAFDQSLLVSTTRSLYVFTGADPASMTSERLAVMQTCVSKRSMVEMMGGVVFACPDGLGYVGPGGFKLLTDGLMTRREWQAYVPSSMLGFESDNKYVCFYDTGSVQKGLIFTLALSEPSFCETDIYATAGFRDRGRDALYLCVNGGGSTRNVQKWDAGTAATMTWQSGVIRFPAPTNVAVARVEYTGTITFELIADGVTKYGPATVTSALAFKLPSGYRSMRYQVKVSGTGTVRAIELADSMQSMVEDK